MSEKKKKSDKKSSKKSGSSKTKDSKKKSSKKNRAAEREAKREARKGDGSFPDILVVTKEKDGDRKYFAAHNGETMETLYKNEQVVAVYKLRRVSKMKIIRKVER